MGSQEVSTAHQRYFLWETNLGEGFSMRRNAFLRAAVLLRKVQLVEDDKGSNTEWTLVLPPMTSHGWMNHHADNGRSRGFLPWGKFLDLDAMRKIHPRIIEIDEYMKLHPHDDEKHINATVLAKVCDGTKPDCHCTMDKVVKWPGVGGFQRRAEKKGDVEECVEHPLLFGITKVSFPHQLVCLPDRWMEADDPKIVGAMLQKGTRDSVYFHDKEQMVDRNHRFWEVRKHVPYSNHLVKAARLFQKRQFNNKAYLALHLRRGDFLQAHPGLVPSLLEVVRIIKTQLTEMDVSDVFIATDGTLGRGHGAHSDVEYINKRLPKGMKASQLYGTNQDGEFHMGEFALIEQIIAAEADYFIGTQSSMFTDLVLQERAIHGRDVSISALFEAEGDVGYERKRAPGSDGVLRHRGYDAKGHLAEPYNLD